MTVKQNIAAERFVNAWQRKSRFVIEGPSGKYSTAWAAWDNKDSVCLAGRTLGGFIKVSMHYHGGYRIAFTKEFHSEIQDRSPKFISRDLAVWAKPNIGKENAALIASVCFPTENLVSEPPPSSPSKPYLIIQTQKMNRAANVGFFLSAASAEKLEGAFSKIGQAFCHWDFSDGTSISMVAWESDFDKNVLPKLNGPAHVVPLTKSGIIVPSDNQGSLTALFWNEPGESGPLRMIEMGGVTFNRT